jgi:quinolinate synthase
MFSSKESYTPEKSVIHLTQDMAICQADYPLDWYQEDFKPYAQAYLALPDRKLATVIEWMRPYLEKAQEHFGDQLLLLAHYYMGGEIVRLVEQFGGVIGDSYQLALMAVRQPEKKVIVESAVHFMAESISLLANADQRVYITNPKAGCTMEMMAKDFMVEPAFLDLNARYGEENILPICYMNTSGRVKALTGAQGGAVCTSSNVQKIVRWAREKGKKILFIPDKHMGENVAYWLGINKLAYWPGGTAGAQFSLEAQDKKTLQRFDEAELILFASYCAVHDYYKASMCEYWKKLGFTVVVHPECPNEVIRAADEIGSTSFIWDLVMQDRAGSKRYAIATENHLVQNLKEQALAKGIQVVNVGEAPIEAQGLGIGCGCATMSRNDPPHLVALLDLLRQGKTLNYNQVYPGDVVNEFTGVRQRLSKEEQAWIVKYARIALENMIRITEGP